MRSTAATGWATRPPRPPPAAAVRRRPRARAVRAKVIDQDQDATAYTGTVNVTALTPAQRTTALRALVSASALSPDLGRSLTSKLDDALKALAAGKTKAACSALGDFTSQVKAQRGKAIPVATADAWLAETALILTAAGC